MYLADTDVVSELARSHADAGVLEFFAGALSRGEPVYVSVVTIGEILRGIRLVAHRGDERQFARLDAWYRTVFRDYRERIVDVGLAEAAAWSTMRVPHSENALDKLIAATASTREWTLVTGNVAHFRGLGVRLLNPFRRH